MTKDKRNTLRAKQAWPTKDVMEQVYAMKLWGSNGTPFYSGVGSHHNELVTPYIETLKLFIKTYKTEPVVCDLGCGDFNIGKELVKHTKKYIAVDIVTNLIKYNKKKFEYTNLEFQCLNITTDNLPFGDCAILRQVLQHLSNSEIKQIVKKLYKYKYLIVTEHLPEYDFFPNQDIISGQGIRLKKDSGVDLLAPPFNLKVKSNKCLLRLKSKAFEGVIVTHLYKL